MKNIYGMTRHFLSRSSMSLAGIMLALSLGLVWNFFSQREEGASADCSMFSTPPSPHAIEKMLSSDMSSSEVFRASLGVDMGWVKDMWKNEDARCFDDSLESFMASRGDVCIPCYTDPVPWDEDTRYTMQDSGCGKQILRTKVKAGDSMGSLLRPWLDKGELKDAIRAVSSVFKVSRLRIGRTYSVERDMKVGAVSRIMYDIDDESRLVLCREGQGFSASVNVYHYDTRLVRVAGEVKSSLFDAMTEAGEASSLAMQLADVFSHQVNFLDDVRAGDTFEVIVEKKYLEGDFRAYGDIVAARLVNDGMVYEAFRFRDENGVARYYAEDGSSLETQFLKAPLNFTRISSSYTMKRRHPVLGRVRPHQGIDYAAPRGTPVKALGDGAVTFVGWKSGYGKSVAIRHSGGVETHYAHLSRYAKNLKKGDKVEQGQVIAYVGSTGISTGPHLDFRVKKNGKFIDPLKLTGNRAAAIPEEQKDTFRNQVERARLMLDGEVILASR